MTAPLPSVPNGNAQHPIVLVVISAKDLAASAAFYRTLFGWQLQALGAELMAGVTPSGPGVALRRDVADGAQSAVPFVAVRDVRHALDAVTADGGTLDRAPWAMPGVGTMARFVDPNGTMYGLIDGETGSTTAHVPMPFGANPKPPANGVCSLEMYAADGATAGAWFGTHFGWGSAQTMPSFMAFDPGAGIGGVWQGHTPATKSMVYLYSNNVDSTVTAIEANGGARMGDPMAMPGMGTFGYFTDPSGTVMGLIGPA